MTRIGPDLLVLGGTRSGKSTYALEWAKRIGGDDVTFVATAFRGRGDSDLDDRIAGHLAYRPGAWRTVEAGSGLATILPTVPGADRPEAVILIDCLTLWVSTIAEAERPIAEAWAELSEALGSVRAHVVAVSDEVGHGVVPAYELGRRFRDDQGWLNQRVAAAADEVVLMIAGIPLPLKRPG